MDCTVHLLMDLELANRYIGHPDLTSFHVVYASREDMKHELAASFYDAVFLSDYDLEVLTALKHIKALETRVILVANQEITFPDVDHVINGPLTGHKMLSYLKSIDRIAKIIKVCNLIDLMRRALLESSKDAGKQAKRVPVLVKALCQELLLDSKRTTNYTRSFYREVVMYSAIHDIGKVGVRDDILNYRGIYDEAQRHVMRKHVEIGAELYSKVMDKSEGAMSMIGYNIIKYHHERFDGGGYPEGLKGKKIPFEARIVGIIDVYDALMSKRIYKKKTKPNRVLEIIKEESGKHFDPDLAQIVIAKHHEFSKLYKRQFKFHRLIQKNRAIR